MPDLQAVQDAQATGWLAIASTVVTAVTVGVAQVAQGKRIEAAANSAPEEVTRRIEQAERHIEELREHKEAAHEKIWDAIRENEGDIKEIKADVRNILAGQNEIKTDVKALLKQGGNGHV